MLPSFLLALREGVEAALVISIVLGVLRRLDRTELKPAVGFGAGLAALICMAIAFGLRLVGSELEGQAEAIYEGITLWVAAAILTWMIFWMQRQSRAYSRGLEQRVRSSLAGSGRWPVFWLAFMAVFKEGLELSLFLVAAGITDGGLQTLGGAGLGLLAAGGIGWVLFTSTRRLPLASFFRFTNVLLILFAAGLFGQGMRAFNEAALIPPLVEPLYNLNPILNSNSTLGQLLTTLFGYNGAPSLSEVLAYVAYFSLLVVGLRFFFRNTVARQAVH